jgi:hypothetical protein
LPKEGKNLNEIKNWRPITLSNCDSKIITKALATRMANHLNEIIDPSQTAYVPGRSVMDNIRSNFYIKNLCESKKIDGLLISLDAKKAFDSVSHEYIRETLRAYGFGDKFVQYFNTLYNGLSVKVLVNGFFSEKINIERGVKQGDALSCSLFILCMDPLIRNLNENKKIEPITFQSKLTHTVVKHKASGYADDIAIVCRNKLGSVQEVFFEYERLTKKSGLELNADKTEILRIGHLNEREVLLSINYMGIAYKIRNVAQMKICGLYFCNDPVVEYDHNILSKVERFELQLKKWMCRNLTLEGKILIIKTYGLSQLIYNLQCYGILQKELVLIERLIFKFIWSKDWNKLHVCERIKRSVLKAEYEEGGLKAPDIECLDRSLKLKQFLRASKSRHVIASFQTYSSENLGYDEVINQDYHKLTQDDWISKVGQETINILSDHARSIMYGGVEIAETSTIAINTVGSIYIPDYLKRKGKLLADCVFNKFKEEGLESLKDLTLELEVTRDRNRLNLLKFIESNFDQNLIEVAKVFNDDLNTELVTLTHIFLGNDTYAPIHDITVKQLQKLLKSALGKTSKTPFERKLGISNFDPDCIMKVRKQISNVKLRNVFYRLINNDFFTKSKMLKFKMTDSAECERCGAEESTKHLLWDCPSSQLAWKNYNIILEDRNLGLDKIVSYEKVFDFGGTACATLIKLKIINEFIQIERPKQMSESKILSVINQLLITEKYIAIKNQKLDKFKERWKSFL